MLNVNKKNKSKKKEKNIKKNKKCESSKEKQNESNKVKHNKNKRNLNTRHFNENLGKLRMSDFLTGSESEKYKTTNNKDRHDTEQWGDHHNQKDSDSIRVWYTNPCGIGVDARSTKSHGSLRFLKNSSKADVVCLAETNVN